MPVTDSLLAGRLGDKKVHSVSVYIYVCILRECVYIYGMCSFLSVCLCVLFLHAQGGGLLLSAVIQYILYNNWQCVGGSRHLERCNPCRASLYTLHVCVSVHVLLYVCVGVHPAATNRYSVIYSS